MGVIAKDIECEALRTNTFHAVSGSVCDRIGFETPDKQADRRYVVASRGMMRGDSPDIHCMRELFEGAVNEIKIIAVVQINCFAAAQLPVIQVLQDEKQILK